MLHSKMVADWALLELFTFLLRISGHIRCGSIIHNFDQKLFICILMSADSAVLNGWNRWMAFGTCEVESLN